jgi:hypothetical protein
VLGPAVGYGLAASLRDWPSPDVVLRLDAVTGSGRATLRQGAASARYGFQVATGGLALAWRATPGWLGGGTLLAGPRLSALWIDRRFDLGLANLPQRALTVTPGLLAGLSLPLGRGFTASAELQLDWAVVKLDGKDRSTAFAEGLVGVGWKFR